MDIDRRIFDVKTRNLYKNLCKKIAAEHFNITLPYDRNYNYLWYMYTKGVKAGDTPDFIILAELNLLMKFEMLDETNFENMRKMLISEDEGNIYMAILSIKALRKERIKKYGEFTTVENASPKFIEIAQSYIQFITPKTVELS